MAQLTRYRHGGARALVLLHERHLREFLETWRQFQASGKSLPETDDPRYRSSEVLLAHVLSAAGSYMTWMCEKLGLPDPEIEAIPEESAIEAEAQRYMEHLLERWRVPLADVAEGACYKPAYTSRWGVEYCIDAMLEHAVMHPIRHTFQLRELMEAQ